MIPCLLLKNGLLVRSELFSIHQVIGNPVHEVERFSQWSVDELIYLDISETETYDLRRGDTKVKGTDDQLRILEEVSCRCFMPLTFGGRIRTIDDIRERIQKGADKIAINTAAVETPSLVTEGAKMFGSQCIVVSIDVMRHPDGRCEVYTRGGKKPTGRNPAEWAREVENLGAGEIFLNSIDRDGTGQGYDLDLIREVTDVTRIPIIACGGVGQYGDFAKGIKAGASAVSAANIFHFKELSDRNAKRAMQKAGVAVRI
ncbi:MAG: imidazole glycerol phosphate synthase cyclase subunit [Deltaproteobacteria bacterium]|nr:imidazole glycerol phosphate synthase cyclase subunit [Deltaproteobacteria bacterium]